MIGITNSGGDESNYIATIAVSAGANGSTSPSGIVRVVKGGDITITFTPNSGYIIDDVIVDGKSVGRSNSYTFTNVQTDHTVHVGFSVIPVYTIVINPRNESPGASGVTITSNTGNVSTQAARLAIVQATARHCLLPAGDFENITYLDESDLSKDINGDSVSIDGSAGDVMLEIDPWWWTCNMVGELLTIQISPYEIEGGYTAHLWDGQISPHLYIGVFEGNTRIRNGITVLQSGYNSSIPTALQTCDTLTTYARNNGSDMEVNTYNIVTGISWSLVQLLAIFVYGVLNFQDKIVQGYSYGGSTQSSLHTNTTNFTPAGGWTQGTSSSYIDCTILGIKNLYGNAWELRGGVIYNAGSLTVMQDQSQFGQISIGSTAARLLGWQYFETGISTKYSETYITSVVGNSLYPFAPKSPRVGNSSTYFTDCMWNNQDGDRTLLVGGSCDNGAGDGLFAFGVHTDPSYTHRTIAARLQALAPLLKS